MSITTIKEVRLLHYRAFTNARLVFDPMTFLVGRNGAGKSTLMDALGFISEAVTDSLGTALERRGNLEGVRQHQSGSGNRYDVSLAVGLEVDGRAMLYGFRIGSSSAGANYVVKQERLHGMFGCPDFVRDAQGVKTGVAGLAPSPDPESLLLPLIAGANPSWKSLEETLRTISIHQFVPQAIRSEPRIGGEERLDRDGGNAGDVLKRVNEEDRIWIEKQLGVAVPGIKSVQSSARAGRRVIRFLQGDDAQTTQFDASMMSDGTVRSLAILLALRQTPRPSIVLLDEVEDSLYPFAQHVLIDAMVEAAEEIPIVVSTHNPEILSHPAATPDRVRIVQWDRGISRVYHLSSRVRTDLKPPLTVGHLLRSNALWTEEEPSTNGPEAEFFKLG